MKKSGRDGFYRKPRKKLERTTYMYPVLNNGKDKKKKHKKEQSGWKIIKKYSVDFIMSKLNENNEFLNVRGGRTVKIKTQTTMMFKEKGICCINCGKSGNHFALEEDTLGTLRLRLIVPLSDKDFTIMTKDHINPRTFGGKDIQINYQPMCGNCNNLKGAVNKSDLGITYF
jgi:hypothetical protein